MLSDLQKRKITRHFNMHDLSSDGYLSQADVELLMKNVAREFKIAPGSETFAKLKALFEAQWNQLKLFADPNGDGRVTLDEYSA